MKTDPYDSIFYINQSTSLEELGLIFERILTAYGFDLYAIQYTTPELKRLHAKPHYLCNFPKEWVDHYYQSQYYSIDPVITQGKKLRSPYQWSKTWNAIEMSAEQEQLFSEAEAFGVAAGVGLPILQVDNEPGIVSFVSSICDDKEVGQIIAQDHITLTLLATSFHHAVSNFFEKQPHPLAPSLTDREKECLTWAAQGKTDVEIGIILNISHRTVNMHLYNCYKKLNCTSREQAVVKALLLKIIQP